VRRQSRNNYRNYFQLIYANFLAQCATRDIVAAPESTWIHLTMRGLMVSFSRKFGSTILAVALLCALFLVSVPVASVSAGPMCTRPCCAGHAAHAAGSCVNGSCHAAVHRRKAAYTPHRFTPRSEVFCGPSPKGSLIAVSKIAKVLSTASRNESAPPKGSAAALLGRGAPDCSRCASGCANLNRQRNSASVTDAEHLPLPTNVCFGNLRENFARARNALARRSAPRGPPVLFS